MTRADRLRSRCGLEPPTTAGRSVNSGAIPENAGSTGRPAPIAITGTCSDPPSHTSPTRPRYLRARSPSPRRSRISARRRCDSARYGATCGSGGASVDSSLRRAWSSSGAGEAAEEADRGGLGGPDHQLGEALGGGVAPEPRGVDAELIVAAADDDVASQRASQVVDRLAQCRPRPIRLLARILGCDGPIEGRIPMERWDTWNPRWRT